MHGVLAEICEQDQGFCTSEEHAACIPTHVEVVMDKAMAVQVQQAPRNVVSNVPAPGFHSIGKHCWH